MPFRNFEDLINLELIPSNTNENINIPNNILKDSIYNNFAWFSAFEESLDFFPQYIRDLWFNIAEDDSNMIDDEFEEAAPLPQYQQQNEAQRLATLGPVSRQDMGRVREFLGFRDIDLQHNWQLDIEETEFANTSTDQAQFIFQQKEQEANRNINDISIPLQQINIAQLNEGQRHAHDHIVSACENMLQTPQSSTPYYAIVMGTAGVGKSFLIRTLEQNIWNLAKEYCGEAMYPDLHKAIRLVAFTGKAAFQVGGETIHCLLPMWDLRKTNRELSSETLRKYQKSLRDCFLSL